MILAASSGHEVAEIVPHLRGLVSCKVQGYPLKSGDFVFEGNGPEGPIMIAIERKKITDMVSSMRNGRLAGFQIINMSAYDLCYVVIEGVYRPGRTGLLETYNPARREKWAPIKTGKSGRPCQYAELDRHVVSLEDQRNIVFVRTSSELETAHVIANRWARWSKPYDAHVSVEALRFQTEVRLHATQCRDFATRFSGVGWSRSKDVARKFGSIENVVWATKDELVECLGEKLGNYMYARIRTKA